MNKTPPPSSFYTVHIRKEALKFSAAHMTVFPDGSKENLHGHNYRTEVSFDFKNFDLPSMIPFNQIKSAVKQICQAWDEKVILAKRNPHYQELPAPAQQIHFTLCKKEYSLPRDEVVFLDTDNVTTESLAQIFSLQLQALLNPLLQSHSISRLEVRIDEILGQGASYTTVFNS